MRFTLFLRGTRPQKRLCEGEPKLRAEGVAVIRRRSNLLTMDRLPRPLRRPRNDERKGTRNDRALKLAMSPM